MTFEGRRLRFQFRSQGVLRFPPGKAGNTLRGAFGMVSGPEVFAPVQSSGPSGLADPPRCFVFRAHHLDGQEIGPGETFHVDVHLFDTCAAIAGEFGRAMGEMAAAGLGSARVPVRLVEHSSELLAFPLDEEAAPVSRLRLRFVTPTELKSAGELVAEPRFGPLFARIRDRASTLRSLYGAGPLAIDFRGLADRAEQVRMTFCEVHQEDAERRSSRTGQRHSLGGFIGEAVYEGDLAPFVGWVRAAEFCGVGRQTVWGKGVIQIVECPVSTGFCAT